MSDPVNEPMSTRARGVRELRRRITIPAILALLLAGWFTGRGAYALYDASTQSAGSRFATGTVVLSDDDAGGAVVTLNSAHPGDTSVGCINVTYTGSIPAVARLYASVSGGLATYVTLTVTRGTLSAPSFNSCSSFTPDATNYIGAGSGVVYSGLLSSYPSGWGTGIVDPPTGPQTWQAGDSHAYRIQVTLGSDSGAEGLSSNVTFDWEARNT